MEQISLLAAYDIEPLQPGLSHDRLRSPNKFIRHCWTAHEDLLESFLVLPFSADMLHPALIGVLVVDIVLIVMEWTYIMSEIMRVDDD